MGNIPVIFPVHGEWVRDLSLVCMSRPLCCCIVAVASARWLGVVARCSRSDAIINRSNASCICLAVCAWTSPNRRQILVHRILLINIQRSSGAAVDYVVMAHRCPGPETPVTNHRSICTSSVANVCGAVWPIDMSAKLSLARVEL